MKDKGFRIQLVPFLSKLQIEPIPESCILHPLLEMFDEVYV